MKSLWVHWPLLRREIALAKYLLLFLDYDGTLTPVVDDPSKAHLPISMKHLIQQLVSQPGVRVVVISGRRLKELKRLVGIKPLHYIGNHGLELQGPRLRYVNPVALRERPLLQRIARHLKMRLKPIRGAWVEDKGLTLSIHFRKVKRSDRVRVKQIVQESIRPYRQTGRVRATFGKMVLEIRPPVLWHKGKIVDWLMARGEKVFSAKKGLFPVYLGDDLTDENAFALLRSKGLTIRVGPFTKRTLARYGLRSPQQVRVLLRRILAIRVGKVK